MHFYMLMQAAEKVAEVAPVVEKAADATAEGQPLWLVIVGLVIATLTTAWGLYEKRGKLTATNVLKAVTKGVKAVEVEDENASKTTKSNIAKVAAELGVGGHLDGFLKKFGIK